MLKMARLSSSVYPGKRSHNKRDWKVTGAEFVEFESLFMYETRLQNNLRANIKKTYPALFGIAIISLSTQHLPECLRLLAFHNEIIIIWFWNPPQHFLGTVLLIANAAFTHPDETRMRIVKHKHVTAVQRLGERSHLSIKNWCSKRMKTTSDALFC